MADERAIGDYVVPRITKAAQAAGRSGTPRRRRRPVALCSKATSTRRSLRERGARPRGLLPNYVRLLEHGDAEDVGDTMAVGDESTVLARCSATATPASPISPSGWSHSGSDYGTPAGRGSGLSPSLRRCSPNLLEGHKFPSTRRAPAHRAEEQVDAGRAGVETVTSLANDFCRVARPVELVGQKRQRGQTLRRDITQVLRHVEHRMSPASPVPTIVTSAPSDGGQPSVVSRTSPGTRSWKATYPDDIGQKRDEGLGRMASHDDMVQPFGHV